MSWKTSPLVGSKIIRLFRNTLTAAHMYSRHRSEKLRQQGQMLVYQKKKTFSVIFIAFLESTENFAHFQKKDHFHSLNISEVIDHDKCSYFNARKLLF